MPGSAAIRASHCPICASRPLPLSEYVETIGDAERVLNMLVGDTQGIELFAERGFAMPSRCRPM
jgi:hypothetical protein